MNEYIRNLNRIEFVVTYSCTGKCRHCSQGGQPHPKGYVKPDTAAEVVRKTAEKFAVNSVMTFGGEPLLFPETVFAAHRAAAEMNIPERSLITNGFFTTDSVRIRETARELVQSGVNGILISVDAFHQETIPLEPVREFAHALKNIGARVRIQPAWVVNKNHDNPYNRRTEELLTELEGEGFARSKGNDIIPDGNALKYLGSYYDPDRKYISPYEENPCDIRTISVEPDGKVLDGNVYETDILKILENYKPTQ